MKPLATKTVVALVSAFLAQAAGATIELLQDLDACEVFSGSAQQIPLRWRNPGVSQVNAEIHCRLLQVSSATAVRVADFFWKRLPILPGQTVLEQATVEIPAVRSPTAFILQWTEAGDKVLGTSRLKAYPTNLFEGLKVAGVIGLRDPRGFISSVLKSNGLRLFDLREARGFEGKLCILCGESEIEAARAVRSRAKALAEQGVAVLLLEPPPKAPTGKLSLPFHVARDHKGPIVTAAFLPSDRFATEPKEQLHLLNLANLALNPETMPQPEN